MYVTFFWVYFYHIHIFPAFSLCVKNCNCVSVCECEVCSFGHLLDIVSHTGKTGIVISCYWSGLGKRNSADDLSSTEGTYVYFSIQQHLSTEKEDKEVKIMETKVFNENREGWYTVQEQLYLFIYF